ncbi:DUF1833 domain-containing protein [Cupriavidus gilardii]|uniref:DUF1833 domain-containing protein n=1 Tax=Cupriavidus gilardii TaxID=82541 RepID=UPI0021B1F7C4|nr:DUF1833 domain-containing protein [Cupriavidus gilardii]UXC34775.1 DUF1833 domain-containing protein [Cupriavidus gilardii]UXC37357.1 DUF1833 domain-containing protein [Cupriavidus gilardii]
MSLDINGKLRTFFASAPQTKYVVPVLEIRHSAMSNAWYLWREGVEGKVTLETGRVVVAEGANFSVKLAGTPAHLDQEYSFTLSTVDIEDKFRAELDRIPIDTKEKIVLVYREYLSDDLGYPNAVAKLQVESLSYELGAATISAVAPRLNITRTGELYTPKEIPMLRGFL